nr:MAG TPA: hypothetical protein [Caudoviricetes sp.]
MLIRRIQVEGSTTILNRSTLKQVEMGNTLTDEAEGEDIV